MVALINNLTAMECIDVRYIHCNYAGKNKVIEMLCKQKGMDENFEYTMPIKWKFAMLYYQEN